jgi:hypothetical protein
VVVKEVIEQRSVGGGRKSSRARAGSHNLALVMGDAWTSSNGLGGKGRVERFWLLVRWKERVGIEAV